MAEKAIQVYVRKGDRDEERLLSFRRPQDIPQHHILAAGMALDGNAVITGIGYDAEPGVYRHPKVAIVGSPSQSQIDLAKILNIDVVEGPPSAETDSGSQDDAWSTGCTRFGHSSLADALNCLESLLAVWLYSYGYMPEFE